MSVSKLLRAWKRSGSPSWESRHLKKQGVRLTYERTGSDSLDTFALEESADAPRTVTPRSDIEKNKTEQHSEFAVIADWPEAMWRVAQGIGSGHFTAGDERGKDCEHPEGNEYAAEKFDDPGGEHQRDVPHRGTAENAKKLLRTVAGKQEASHQAHQTVKVVREPIQE